MMSNKERSIEQIKSDLEASQVSFYNAMKESTEAMQKIISELDSLRGSRTKKRNEYLDPDPNLPFSKDHYSGSDCGEAPEPAGNKKADEDPNFIQIYEYNYIKKDVLSFFYGDLLLLDLDYVAYLTSCQNTKNTEFNDYDILNNDGYYLLGYVPAKDKKRLKFDASALLRQEHTNNFPINVGYINWFDLNEGNYLNLAQLLLADSHFWPTEHYENSILNINYKLTRAHLYSIVSNVETFKYYCKHYLLGDMLKKNIYFELKDMNDHFYTPDIDKEYLADTDEYSYNSDTMKALFNRSVFELLDYDYIEIVLGRFLQCFIECHVALKDRKESLEDQFIDLDRYFKQF
jgi:hypothetical protein